MTAPGRTGRGKAEAPRVFVFGDVHGDLDVLLSSLAERGLLRYDGDLDGILAEITGNLEEPFFPSLEAMVIPQDPPVKVILTGDLVDRYPHAYHVVQFVMKIRWSNFGIELVPLLGNHDLLNLLFFTNPLKAHCLLEGAGRTKQEVMQYIGGMGIEESLDSFFALHRQEIFRIQAHFYRWGKLSYPVANYSILLKYPRNFSWLAKRRILKVQSRPSADGALREAIYDPEELDQYYRELASGLEAPDDIAPNRWPRDSLRSFMYDVLELFGPFIKESGEQNWWQISWFEEDEWYSYSPDVNLFNVFTRPAGENQVQILPIDWRIISLVWRRHYARYFLNTQLMHVQGRTLFSHAGLSPLSMFDPMVFGALYLPTRDNFKSLKPARRISLEELAARTNRIYLQMLENALNDCSFRRFAGAELLDQMGTWRGGAEGLPEFGGLVWADFNCLWHRTKGGENNNILSLYRRFAEATGLERVVCGHTYFISLDHPEVKFRKLEALGSAGIDYICVDNGCSRAYRRDNPVTTGIEITPEGEITDPGELLRR